LGLYRYEKNDPKFTMKTSIPILAVALAGATGIDPFPFK
jgi:hypothetical protein